MDSSRLEASYGAMKVERRRISLEVQQVSRHATESDLVTKDLEIDYNVKIDSFLQRLSPSIQCILPALQYGKHMENSHNFANETKIECFDQNETYANFLTLDSTGLERVLETVTRGDISTGTVPPNTLPVRGTHLPASQSPTISSTSAMSYNLANKTSSSSANSSLHTQIPEQLATATNMARSSTTLSSDTTCVSVKSPNSNVSGGFPFPAQASNIPTSAAKSSDLVHTSNSTNLQSTHASPKTVGEVEATEQPYSSTPAGIRSTNLASPTATRPNIASSKQTSQPVEVASSTGTDAQGRLLVFFVPLKADKDASFGSQVSMQRSSVEQLFERLGVNPEFLLNLLGRPDYWSPRTRWQYSISNEVTQCDYFCQHPRWNVQVQGAPLSVYVIRHMKTKLNAYIISHNEGDSSVHALQQILKVGISSFAMKENSSTHLTNPFDIAVLLSTLSLEASKHHVAKFRRYMWEQVNKVDDHLAGLETNDRGRLTELTKKLQIISQQADFHLLNANVAILTARGVCEAQAKLHDHLSTPHIFRQPAEDAIQYVIDSLEKQKMIFLNYKSRKDGTMGLVYNLVTQSDAANNIELAKSMKQDSTSMSAIAALTMIFLPGTFTSSILSAGIFSAEKGSRGISTSRMWWFWIALTLPLTVIVLIAWWIYRTRDERQRRKVNGHDLQTTHQAV